MSEKKKIYLKFILAACLQIYCLFFFFLHLIATCYLALELLLSLDVNRLQISHECARAHTHAQIYKIENK